MSAPPDLVLHRGVVQSGRTPASGAGGRRFESCYPDHLSYAASVQSGVDTGLSRR